MKDMTLSRDAILNMRQCIALVAVTSSSLQHVGGCQRSQSEALRHLREVMVLATALGEQVLDEVQLAERREERAAA
ncbi:hypothetical protein Q9295_01700 [Xinfangfangia sp. CPCC 101601]|uniref:Uncharacterized protein n=1 Tax=Pseudogemmobacter lacusdianii TaxID=3069608 RepID=A0ABU0VTL3_9RHOB|nr:hypothetical protein [Xinfangfangia sp. CPCC 101601]MDQ2065072.1 hypothetical protein [Xinfangfangia sp. CPCC 101601]